MNQMEAKSTSRTSGRASPQAFPRAKDLQDSAHGAARPGFPGPGVCATSEGYEPKNNLANMEQNLIDKLHHPLHDDDEADELTTTFDALELHDANLPDMHNETFTFKDPVVAASSQQLLQALNVPDRAVLCGDGAAVITW